MQKHYTRACNFYYGTKARKLLKKRQALPLCGNQDIVFKYAPNVVMGVKKLKKWAENLDSF